MPKIRVTLTDIFKTYPYKKKQGGVLENAGPLYFPKNEIVEDHKFSLTRQEFMEIANVLFRKRFEDLLEGQRIKLPSRSGHLELFKYRPKKPSIDFKATKEIYGEHNKNNPNDKKVIYHKNYHTNGYKPLLKWDKRKAVFKNKQIYKFDLVRNRDREMNQFFQKSPFKINNLNSA